MSTLQWLAIFASGAGLAYLLRGVLPPSQALEWEGRSPDDAEYLARVTMLEAARGSREEWIAIQWVAINRARAAQISVRDVVATTSWPGGGASGRAFVEAVQAPSGVSYRSAFGHPSPPDVRGYDRALDVAHAILAGEIRNPIGGRTHFVHPQSLRRCDVAGELPDGRICLDGRAYPRWAVSKDQGGRAALDPRRIGRAVFS